MFYVRHHVSIYLDMFVASIKTNVRKFSLTLNNSHCKWRSKMDFGCQFYNDWKKSIAIRQWGCVGWRPKQFDCHSTHPHHHMVIESFWLPKRAWGGFRKNYITIWHTLVVRWQLKGLGVCVIILGKKKFIPHFTSWAIKEFQSPSNNGGMSNGNQIFSVTQKGMGGKGMKWQ